MRKTKIVATLGPATSDDGMIEKLIEAGMDVARLNFSHGEHSDHRRTIELLRELSARVGRAVAIIADLPGPKIRTGRLRAGQPVQLKSGQRLTLTGEKLLGTAERISINYPRLIQDFRAGDRVLLGVADAHGGQFASHALLQALEAVLDEVPASPMELARIVGALSVEAPAEDAGPTDATDRAAEADVWRERLAALPAGHSAAVVLRHVWDMSYAEVAETLEVPVGTAKGHVHRGLAALRAQLDAETTMTEVRR